MEQTTQDYLKEAIQEEHDETRIELISKALKQITDILPFEKKRDSLYQDRKIFKYLLVLKSSFNSPVEMVLDSFVQMFGNELIFLQNFWQAIWDLVELDEDNISNQIMQINLIKRETHNEIDYEQQVVEEQENEFRRKLWEQLGLIYDQDDLDDRNVEIEDIKKMSSHVKAKKAEIKIDALGYLPRLLRLIQAVEINLIFIILLETIIL